MFLVFYFMQWGIRATRVYIELNTKIPIISRKKRLFAEYGTFKRPKCTRTLILKYQCFT